MRLVRAGIAWLFCLLLAGSFAMAQGPDKADQEQMKKNKEEKLAKEYFKKAKWITDFDQAKEEAKKSGKPIFAYFTRSYAQ